ncbi:MAG: methionyl-tRNA formyltransferase [Alphaproteobacteria bacterium]
MSTEHKSHNPLNVVFMGTPDFATSALKALIKSPHNICAVYSQPPRPKGRGHKVQKSPVQELAEAHGIPVYTPKTLKTAQIQEQFTAHKADIAVVAAYGLLLPQAVLDAPRFGCLNIHGSLLPAWRGASPIQHAIWKGDKKSGITIMQMDAGMDTGAMILQDELALGGNMTAAQLHDRLADMGARLIIEVLGKLAKDRKRPDARIQVNDLASYAPLLTKKDGQVNWTHTAMEIDRQVRALNPWPGVWTQKQDAQRFKIIKAKALKNAYPVQEKPGTLLNKEGEVMCGDGSVLKVLKLQPAGKKAMDFASALNGGYLFIGDIFE